MADRSTMQKQSAPRLACAKCHYDLTGLRDNVCPECGTPFDPAALPRRRRPHWLLTVITTVVVMYAPFGWIVFVHDDASYVRTWQKLFPVLPGLAPTFALAVPFNYPPGKLPEWLATSIMGAIALGFGLLIFWLARRSFIAFMITMIIALLASIASSRMAYAIFAA